MNLVKQRNSWREDYESGIKPYFPPYDEYVLNRDSEMWRSSALAERFYEYVLYLEEKANEVHTKRRED